MISAAIKDSDENNSQLADSEVARLLTVLQNAEFTKSKTPNLTQICLERIVPKKWLMTAHHILIFHGRQICKARKPLCNICSVNKICYYRKGNLQP